MDLGDDSKREEEEDWEFSDKRKQRSRKHVNDDEVEVEASDGCVRRKRSGKVDGDDYDSRSKQASKKRQEESSTLEKLSSFYEDGELDGGDKMGRNSHRASASSKEDPRSDDKNRGSSDQQVRSSRSKWDEVDIVSVKKTQDSVSEKGDLKSAKVSESKREGSRERIGSGRNEHGESKSSGGGDRVVVKSGSKDDRKGDSDRGKSRSKSEAPDERVEKPRRHRTPTGYDVSENWDRSGNADEDGNVRVRDKAVRETGNSNRSRTPERSGKRHQDSEGSEVDYERSGSLKRKEIENDGYKDDRSKGKDENWSDRRKERESSKESWKRRQPGNMDRDSKNEDSSFDHGREWDLPRHGYERMDNERPHGRSGGRKDVMRGEAVKTSTKYGISNDNYDVIEIQPKFVDYGKTDSVSNPGKRTEANQQYSGKSGTNHEEWGYHQEERARKGDLSSSGTPGEDQKERYADDDHDYYGGRGRGQRGFGSTRGTSGQSSSSGGSQSQYGNLDSGSFNRGGPQGIKGNRVGRGGRSRPPGRDNQQVGMPLPIMGSPYGPLGMPPPGPMQPLTHGMSPGPGPPMSPGVFISTFNPAVWAGARGVDMNMMGVPSAVSPVTPGPSGPRFNANNVGNPGLRMARHSAAMAP